MSKGKPLVCVHDYATQAAQALPPTVLEYYRGGAGDETTLRDNKTAANGWYILPRMLRPVSRRCLTSAVFEASLRMPVASAPTAMQRMAHPDGECAAARACGRHGTVYVLSTNSSASIEEVAEAAPDTVKYLQLYIYRNRSLSESLVKRAEHAGYCGVVLTIDTPVVGIRRGETRDNFIPPSEIRMSNFDQDCREGDMPRDQSQREYFSDLLDPDLVWEDIAWLKRLTSLPVIVKGVLTRQDAALALKAGVAAIWVSNHGGRQVDTVPPTIEALPHIVAEVSGRCPVFVDGGFTQGTEVFKALALGASLVFVGRPVLWGLACGGEDGVHHVLSIIREELDNIMANTGCSSLQDIDSTLVTRRELYSKM